jgi:hypothetical protein
MWRILFGRICRWLPTAKHEQRSKRSSSSNRSDEIASCYCELFL